jgi:hypothetical protein
MFTIKEVAPSRSKSAFWEQDIKTARALKKGNKKIDMNVIMAGLQDAIEKEELAKQQGQANRLTLPRRLHRASRPSMYHAQPEVVNYNIHSNPPINEDVFDDALGGMLEPSPLFDDVVSWSKKFVHCLVG